MAEALRAIISSKSAMLLQRSTVDSKFQVEGVAPVQPFFFSENKVKWSFVWYKNLHLFFFRLVTIHAFDRQTDGGTDRILIAGPRLHSCSVVIKSTQLWTEVQEKQKLTDQENTENTQNTLKTFKHEGATES